jgi:ribosomal protein S24E
MEIRKDFSNSLLKRRELELVLTDEKNPGFAKVQKKIAEKFKSSEENVVVKKVASGFGVNEFKVDAFVYEDATAKEDVEPKIKEKKKKEGN